MRVKLRLCTLAALFVFPACSDLSPVAPGTRAIVLDHPQTCHVDSLGTLTFPAGRYEPRFRAPGGVYYQAARPLIFRDDLRAGTVPGGLFVPPSSDMQQGFWTELKGSQTFSMRERVVFRYAP